MRRLAWYEAEQAYSDLEEADLVAARQRVGLEKASSTDTKGSQAGEAEAVSLIPVGPQSWIRSVPYTTAGQVAVPKKPYHQDATLVGAGNVAFQVSFHPSFPLGQTATLPGDRNHCFTVYAGQQLYVRSDIIIGMLAVLITPTLDDQGQTISHTNGNEPKRN